jgi:hypothetical protein
VLVAEDTVRFEKTAAPPTDTEGALSRHVGAGVPPPVTAQDSETVPV